MGNTQPTNKSGRKETDKKLANAEKLGVLSLSEHGLTEVPRQLVENPALRKLRTLDLSNNQITHLSPQLSNFTELKSLNLDHNQLTGTETSWLKVLSSLNKLQNLSMSHNRLGQHTLPAVGSAKHKHRLGAGVLHVAKAPHPTTPAVTAMPRSPAQPTTMPLTIFFPELPSTLKQLGLAHNFYSSIPAAVLSRSLANLEKLDLSGNRLALVPKEIANLISLQQLILDDNVLLRIPDEISQLRQLKALSLRNNQLSKNTEPPCLPLGLFVDTALIDLNLHGNPMTNTELNSFPGFETFLDRRQKVKSKTMQNLSVCGLK